MARISPISVSKHLGGIDFPAGKNELVEHARTKNADDQIIEILQHMPEKRYENMADVMKGVGQVH